MTLVNGTRFMQPRKDTGKGIDLNWKFPNTVPNSKPMKGKNFTNTESHIKIQPLISPSRQFFGKTKA